jgi:vacuolar-type H+-ATPase subunit F/Vma7
VGAVAAIGEQVRVAGLALVGVAVFPAEDADTVRRSWREMPGEVALVIVTPAAAEALGPAPLRGTSPLTAVLPPW